MSTVLDEEDVDLDQTESFENGFAGEPAMLAKHYVDLYFCDKQLYGGGSIPKNLLHSERYISSVLNMNFCKTWMLFMTISGLNIQENICKILNDKDCRQSLNNCQIT